MSTLEGFMNRLLGVTPKQPIQPKLIPKPAPKPVATMLPMVILKATQRQDLVMQKLDAKIADERETLNALQIQRRTIAYDVEQGDAQESKLTAVNTKIAKQQGKVDDLVAARAEAQLRQQAEQNAAAAKREAQRKADIISLLDEYRNAARNIDKAVKLFASDRERIREIAARLKVQGVDFGLSKLHVKALIDLAFLTRGATGAFPPRMETKDIGVEKQVPTDEAIFAAMERERAHKTAH